MEQTKTRWRLTLDGMKSPGFLLVLGLVNLFLLIGIGAKVHKIYWSHHIMMKGGYGDMRMDDRYDRGGWSQGYDGMRGGKRGMMMQPAVDNPDAPVQGPAMPGTTEPAPAEQTQNTPITQ